MNLVADIKNIYIKEIRKELEKMLEENKDPNNRTDDIGPSDYIYRTGIISGLEKAINLIKEYE